MIPQDKFFVFNALANIMVFLFVFNKSWMQSKSASRIYIATNLTFSKND